jgi:uncharacterized protein (DUF2267 family)
MTPDPLIQDLCSRAGLRPEQARGVVGVLLNKLKERLPAAEFASIQNQFPGAEDWMRAAPRLPPLKTGGFMLPAMVKAQLLLQMNQALKALDIPTSAASTLGQVLKDSIRTHHPDLEEQVRGLL